ncbi:response regulator [Blautia sp. MSJ-19]|uniref:response regulator n=1 Tax=Blautia sp. MSJ-19 TaxID=2841517 RepID=UPI001C0F38ED|nr:transporter substrate-binding domain-containing protein [Blautia sp. MSJ-19]MBU5481105.1 transporter substrate-binding domain-containing protein [Blautia sp. MSJ-19]
MNTFRNNIQKCTCLVICLFLLLPMVMPVRVSAAESTERKVIRVGAPESIYDDVNAHGERTGYGYEYLQKIANYTGWEYEYVPCTWNDCFEKLQNGEIDILEAISYTDERAETMAFSSIPMSEEKYYIFAKLADTDITITDISTFNGKNIGVLKDHLPETVLNEWSEKNHLHMNHLNITTKEEVIERLEKQEIECFVSVEGAFWSESGIAPVTTIGSSGIYFAFRKDSQDIKTDVDNAMLRLSEEYPFFSDDLYRQHFSQASIPVLTREEEEWLSGHGAIRVGYLKNDGGISTLHPDTGEVTGVISDYTLLAENCLYGQTLKFELVGFDSRNDLPDALHNGEIDMIFYVAQNPNSAEARGYDLSDTTWTANMAVITSQDVFDETKENTVAILAGKISLQSYISRNYPKWNITEYESQKDIVQAVCNGEADCFVVDSGDSADYTKEYGFHSFVLSKPNNSSFAVEHGNITLLSILNKTLETVTSSKLSGLLNMHDSELKKITLLDFFRDNLLAVSVLVGSIFLLMLFLLRKSIVAGKKAQKAQRQAEAAGLTLTEEHDDYEDVYVFSSPLHLKKILVNLFTNAVKYNKPNGSIHTSMKTIERTKDTIVCEFKIQDTGIGMSEDFVKNQLFVPFVQADTSARSSYAGTGLGMPIVKNMVDKLGGTITVESKLGAGSTFTVVLPFKLDPDGKPEVQEEIMNCSVSGMRFLMAEDNELNAEIAKVLLEEKGASVTVVENGKKAVDLFVQSPGGTFDAILMDMMMPVMDGITATKTIRALNRSDAKTIPVIAMTANAFAEDAKKCINAGMNAHIAKPLNIEMVEKTICRYVKK